MNSTPRIVTGSDFATIDEFDAWITAPSRAAEAAVPLGRTDTRDRTGGAGWTITKDGVTIELTAFEMRRMIFRVNAVERVEAPIAGQTRREIDPDLAYLVRP
jgi:hypothetical protein